MGVWMAVVNPTGGIGARKGAPALPPSARKVANEAERLCEFAKDVLSIDEWFYHTYVATTWGEPWDPSTTLTAMRICTLRFCQPAGACFAKASNSLRFVTNSTASPVAPPATPASATTVWPVVGS